MGQSPLKNVLSLGRSFWDAQVLLTSARLRIFDGLLEFKEAEDVARSFRLKVRTMTMLLDALTALKFLEKKEGKYRVSPVYQPFLVSTSDKNVLSILDHYYNMYEDWGKLREALKSDKPVETGKRDPKEYYAFIEGMDNLTKFYKDRLVNAIDLKGVKHFLDIGAGPATYLREILKRDKSIKGYILDLPEAIKVAKEFLKRDGLLKRVSFIEGDIATVDINGEFDRVLISQVLHSLNPKVVKKALEKAYRALKKGGKLYVHEFYLNENRTAPKDNVVFCLNMLLHSKGGNNFTVSELKVLLKERGFKNIEAKRFKNPDTVLIVGQKI